MTYSYIGTNITHLCRDHKERIVYGSAAQLQDDRLLIAHDTIQLAFIHDQHCDPFLHPSDNDPGDTQADSKNACIDPEQPPVRRRINAAPYKANPLASRSICNKYFDIFDDDIDLW